MLGTGLAGCSNSSSSEDPAAWETRNIQSVSSETGHDESTDADAGCLYPGASALLEIRMGSGGVGDIREYLCNIKVPENYYAGFFYVDETGSRVDIFENLGMYDDQTVFDAVESCVLTDADVVPSILELTREDDESIFCSFMIADSNTISVESLNGSDPGGVRMNEVENHPAYIVKAAADSKTTAVYKINEDWSLVVSLTGDISGEISLEEIGRSLYQCIVWLPQISDDSE